MNAKTLAFHRKHICPKTPPEAVKDIETITVNCFNRFELLFQAL